MSTPIIVATCPSDSQLKNFLKKVDFEDAYAFQAPKSEEPIEEVYNKIFNTSPKWVEYAMKLRNLLVSPFGLKTEMKRMEGKPIKEGEKIGIFRIYKILENEIIAGDDDKHLNFRVSVHRGTGKEPQITISTIVQYKNFFGRFYMAVVSPFHKLVVKSILKSSVKRFYEEN